MADRARRDRQAKSDKFAAFKLARQGGRREWKVSSTRIRVGCDTYMVATPPLRS